MTITTAMLSASNQLTARHSGTPYSDSIVTDMIAAVAASPAAYNRTVYNYFYAWAVEGVERYIVSQYLATVNTPGWSSDEGVSVDTTVVQSGINAYLAAPTGYPLMLDIETWYTRPASAMDTAIANYQAVAGMWKEQTTRQIGLYSMVPASNYSDATALGTAIGASDTYNEALYRGKLSYDMHLNDYVMGKMWDYVDFLVPRTYVATADSIALWKWYASYAILEAIRLARGEKEVYPIFFYQNTTAPAADLLEAEFLASAQFVASFPGITGTIAWSAANPPAYWIGHIEALVTGDEEGDFPDPVTPP